MIKVNQLQKGIELCLINGKQLLDDAKFLEDKKKFVSAVPLYVIAYEEMNKALFLEDKMYEGKDISDEKHKEIFSRGSHLKKLRLQYKMKKKALEEMTNEEFDHWKNYSKSVNLLWWNTNRKNAIISCNNSLSLLTKLNELKKNFMYVDYVDDKWKTVQNRFGKKLLSNLCKVLYNMTLDLYYTIKLYHKFYEKGMKKSLTKFSPTVYSDDPNFIEYEKIRKMYSTSNWKNTVLQVINLLNSL